MSKKKPEGRSYRAIVEAILRSHPKLRNDPNAFSDYIIASYVTDFMYDPQIKGEHETRKSKAKDIYLGMMEAYEEIRKV